MVPSCILECLNFCMSAVHDNTMFGFPNSNRLETHADLFMVSHTCNKASHLNHLETSLNVRVESAHPTV